MTIAEYYKQRSKRSFYNPTYISGNAATVKDFYDSFIVTKLPSADVVSKWHDLLVSYINEKDAVFFVRKYESGKDEEGKWNNRRGAVTVFADGFEYVFASNMLAHEIYLMACNGFVPTLADFKYMAKSRAINIMSGTKIEEGIRLYPHQNKKLKCYLAHIVTVNGQYLRVDGTVSAVTNAENARIYPRGIKEDWTKHIDKIRKLDYSLTSEQKDIVKAHCLRFLDPINYFITPQTKHTRHAVVGHKNNIGEYDALVVYVAKQYKDRFGKRYDEFIKKARVGVDSASAAVDGLEDVIINLQYDKTYSSQQNTTSLTAVGVTRTRRVNVRAVISPFQIYLQDLQKAPSSARQYDLAVRRIEDADGITLDLSNIDQHIDMYNKGGVRYNPHDHGTTRSALKWYKEYLLSTIE